MKSTIIIAIFLFVISGLNAQSVGLFFNNADTLYVDPDSSFTAQLRVNDFNNVGTLQLTLNWDEASIKLVDYGLADLANVIINDNPGQLLAIWADLAGIGQTLPDGSSILNLTFKASHGWPDTTSISFGTVPFALELNQFDGVTLIPMDEIATSCIVIIRKCLTVISLPKDTLCMTNSPLLLEPVCQQCVAVNWNDTINEPTFYASTSGWVHVSAKGYWDCYATDSVFIAPLPLISLNAKSYNGATISCYGASDGSILAISNDFAKYIWSTGSDLSKIENLGPGVYTVTVTNSAGCTSFSSTSLTNPLPISVSINAVAPLCPNESSGFISIIPTGGVLPFSVSGNVLLDSILSINGLSSGEYPFRIFDNNGCYIDTLIVLNSASTYQPSANLLLRPCYDESNGVLELSGLPPGVEKLVLNGNIIPIENVLNDISSGTNQFMVEDSLGCKYEWGLEVMSVPQHFINIGQDVKYPIGTFVQVKAEAINNTFLNDLNLNWFSDNLQQVFCKDCPSINFKLEGNTEVVLVATTQEGCVDIDTINVAAESKKLYFPNVFAPNSNNDNALFVIHGPVGEQFNIELLEIFDRWGSLMFLKRNFSPNDNSVAWDGTSNGANCPAGVYIWHAKDKNSIHYTGDVTLIR